MALLPLLSASADAPSLLSRLSTFDGLGPTVAVNSAVALSMGYCIRRRCLAVPQQELAGVFVLVLGASFVLETFANAALTAEYVHGDGERGEMRDGLLNQLLVGCLVSFCLLASGIWKKFASAWSGGAPLATRAEDTPEYGSDEGAGDTTESTPDERAPDRTCGSD